MLDPDLPQPDPIALGLEEVAHFHRTRGRFPQDVYDATDHERALAAKWDALRRKGGAL
jgi:hypothetical protein